MGLLSTIAALRNLQRNSINTDRSCKIHCKVFVYSILVLAAHCHGQGTDSLLTWKECVSLALHNNPQLASSKHALEASKFTYYSAYNSLFPQVDLGQSYGKSAGTANATGSNSPAWQTAASVNLDILNMPEITNIKTSKTVIPQFEASRQATSSLVRFNLRTAFAQLLYVQKSLDVSKDILKMRQEQSQLVTLRYNSGRESKGNMLAANAELLQAKADLDQTVRDLRTARQSLGTQMGLEKTTPFNANGILDAQPPPALPKDEEPLLAHRPDIMLPEAVVITAEATLSQAKSAFWPDLSFGYSLVGQGPAGLSTFQNSWNFDLSYPLYSTGPTSAYYAISVAKSNLEKAKQDLRSAREKAVLDIETSWSTFSGSIDQSKVQAALLEAARQRDDEANIRYESGLLTYDNWEIIASDRVTFERSMIQAQLNVMLAEAAWEKALGRQLEE